MGHQATALGASDNHPDTLPAFHFCLHTEVGLGQKPGCYVLCPIRDSAHLLVTTLPSPELTALCCHVILVPPGEEPQSHRPAPIVTGIRARCVLIRDPHTALVLPMHAREMTQELALPWRDVWGVSCTMCIIYFGRGKLCLGDSNKAGQE